MNSSLTAQNKGDIRQLFEVLDIETRPFTKVEIQRARKKTRKYKAHREERVVPEAMKRCDFDDIILEFCILALLETKVVVPDQ